MQNDQRGKIHTPNLAVQLRDFSGLRYGNITPTDIDSFLDFGDRLFVFIEGKLEGVSLPLGQRLALERLTDASVNVSRYAIGIICEHRNRIGAIDFSQCIVVAYRWKKKWNIPTIRYTVKEMVDKTLVMCKMEAYLRNE